MLACQLTMDSTQIRGKEMVGVVDEGNQSLCIVRESRVRNLGGIRRLDWTLITQNAVLIHRESFVLCPQM